MEQRLLTAAQLADYGRELKSLCGPAGVEAAKAVLQMRAARL